jgi:hypothetical protein
MIKLIRVDGQLALKADNEEEWGAIFVAAGMVMRHRIAKKRHLSDDDGDEGMNFTQEDFDEFFDGLDERQLKILCKMAKKINCEGSDSIH